jgi:basic membrane protein A
MNKKRILAGIASLLIVATVFAGCGSSSSSSSSSSSKKIKIGLSTDEGGLNDKSFNQAADTGIKKAVSEFGNIDYKPIESKKSDEYQPNLQSLVDVGSDLVFGVGYQMADALQAVANKYPDKKFAIIDNAYDKQPKNVESLIFKSQEGSFLMGVIAAKETKTNKLGFIGGKQGDLIDSFAAGYIAGARAINPNIQVKVLYADSYSDTAKGKELASTLYGDGYDIVYHAAGGVGIGVFDAAEDARTAGKDVWAIGVDQDQAVTVPKYANVILSSNLKRVDTATYQVVKDLKNGKFAGGTVKVFGLKEDGVGYAPTTKNHVSKDILDLVDKYKQAIIDGKIVVPSKITDANSFTAPSVQ